MTARGDRPSAGWLLLDELPLTVGCPAWCAKNADVHVDLAADSPVCLCLYHAAQAVEDGALDSRDLAVAPAPVQRESAVDGGRGVR